MIFPTTSGPHRALLCCASFLVFSVAHATTKWQDPTPEELSMTSQPQVPGASAVILSREEIVDDGNGTWTYSYRIKILNQAGRDKYSNISIEYPSEGGYSNYTIASIAARTIHADGTIIPFTGKPFDRLVEHSSDQTTREKVIALPNVQVGSIVEYHYSLVLDARIVETGLRTWSFVPTFYAQTELFARKVSFIWHTAEPHIDLTSSLPGGASAVKIKDKSDSREYSVLLENVLPVADEPDMPPRSSISQKVVFYTQLSDSIHTPQAFWKQTGADWSSDIDDFIGRTSKLSRAAAAITADSTTPEEKLRKLYAAVQQMQNTNFSRELSEQEEKLNGISASSSALDVFKNKRGDDLQLTILFVGLARAAGFKAYVMAVTNRDLGRFYPQFTTLRQLNDDIAIVELNGEDIVLDPAEPFCPFGQLLWTHSDTGGLRQMDKGTALAGSPILGVRHSETRRVANLTIDPGGHESGSVDLAFLGAPALRYRQSILLDDELALHQRLEHYLRDHMPKDTDVTLTSIENLRDEDKPLIVHFHVSGPLGLINGKSSLIPAQLFQTNATAAFTAPTRTLPVDFSYPEIIEDAISLQYPPTWKLAASPTEETDTMQKLMDCIYRIQLTPKAVILHRAYIVNTDSIPTSSYQDLRSFDDKVITKDHEMILFHVQPTPAPVP
ncbi:MAG: DUF3857 and transglutaminase domain-containing protein [Acidobacteriaceae bacterium]